MNMYKFGNYICKLREEKSLTQADLAKLLDVSDKSISKWENGQAFPRIETFEKLHFHWIQPSRTYFPQAKTVSRESA